MVRAFVVALAVCCGVAYAEGATSWALPNHGYPVVTKEMRPGIGDIRIKLSYDVIKSVAVVGADNISARWLKINNEYLKSIDTVGIVVNVKTEAEMDILRRYTDIPLLAMPGHSLIEHFGTVYPFVVDKSIGVVRQ